MIGSHLADALVARGEQVLVIDNFSRGSIANIAKAADTGLLKVRHLNLADSGFSIQPDDVVWHLAAKVAGIEYNRTHQYDMLQSNLAINYNVIESVRKQKPHLFVYVSTVCVYPHDAPVPTPESAGDVGNPEPTNHGYGVAKWLGEQMVKHLSKEHNQACLILRFNNVCGPRDYYDDKTSHVIPALIKRTLSGENPVVVWGSGKQTRVFVDVRDVANILVKLYPLIPPLYESTAYACRWKTIGNVLKETGPLVINIGHDREVSIAEVIDTIVRQSGLDVGYEFDTSKPDGHARRMPDVSLLKSILGWLPNRALSDTIADMIEDYRGRA
jgi:GDP-L-fucose synthase